MRKLKLKWPGATWRPYTLIIAATACAAAWSASAQDAIEPEAAKILAAMSDNLKSMPSLRVAYDADQEIVDLEGQKIQYSASGTIALDRTKGFLLTRQGPFADAEVVFDGSTISLHSKGMNVYAQLQSPGPSVEEAADELRAATGLDAPGADLLASDPYTVLTDGVTKGTHVGSAFIGGVECDHLAFRTDIVDWQIWVSKGNKPLPLKYVITTKWVTGAPEYSLRLSDWKAGAIGGAQFKFTPPANARKLEQIHADVTGDISLEVGE